MRTDRPECQVGGDSWVGYVLGTVGCLKEGYTLGYDEDGIHYTYLDRVEWLCRCGLAPYIPELQAEVDLLVSTIDENGIKSLQFVPAIQSNCSTTIASASDRQRILDYIQSLSPTVTIDNQGYITMR